MGGIVPIQMTVRIVLPKSSFKRIVKMNDNEKIQPLSKDPSCPKCSSSNTTMMSSRRKDEKLIKEGNDPMYATLLRLARFGPFNTWECLDCGHEISAYQASGQCVKVEPLEDDNGN